MNRPTCLDIDSQSNPIINNIWSASSSFPFLSPRKLSIAVRHDDPILSQLLVQFHLPRACKVASKCLFFHYSKAVCVRKAGGYWTQALLFLTTLPATISQPHFFELDNNPYMTLAALCSLLLFLAAQLQTDAFLGVASQYQRAFCCLSACTDT